MKNRLLYGLLAALASLSVFAAACTDDDEETPTTEPTEQATEQPSGSPTSEATPDGTGTPDATGTPDGTGTPSATGTPRATPGATGTPRATPGATGTPSGTPGATGTPSGTPGATGTPSGTPGATGTPSGTPGATGTPSGTPGATGTPGGTPGATEDLVALLAADERFSMLSELITTANLEDTLTGEGPFTLFAPTNDALEALDPTVLQELESDPDALTELLSYHLLEDEYTLEELMAMDSVTTVQGEDITLGTEVAGIEVGSLVLNGEVIVEEGDMTSGNGIVHVLETVLTVPEEGAAQ